MQPAYWRKIEKIFFKAVLLPLEERQAFIKKCSGGNDELYCAVCVLIDKDNQPVCFLDEPLFKFAKKIRNFDDKPDFEPGNFKNCKPQ